MSSVSEIALSAIDGIAKLLPALLAAYYAYRLWVYKMARDRADSIVTGAQILKYFSRALERCLRSDPRTAGLASIEVLNPHLPAILITSTLSEQFFVVADIYFRWKAVEYFPPSEDSRRDIDARLRQLNGCQTACDEVMSAIRASSIKALARQNFSSL